MPSARRRLWCQEYDGYDTRADVAGAELAALHLAGVLGEPGTAIDLGCGHGTDLIFLARQGWKAHGVDNENDGPGSLRAARRRRDELPERVAERITLQQGNVLSRTFRPPRKLPRRFDLVLSRLVLNNLLVSEEEPDTPRRIKLVRVAAKLLVDDGLFVLRTSAADFEEPELLEAIRNEFRPHATGGRLSASYAAITTQAVTGAPGILTVGLLEMRMYLLRRRPRRRQNERAQQ